MLLVRNGSVHHAYLRIASYSAQAWRHTIVALSSLFSYYHHYCYDYYFCYCY